MMPHKPRGNILLLALFVLFASALIGILISMMMKNFLHYSQESFYYHQASAMERAARELAFALFDQRDSGLNYEFNSQDTDFSAHNFDCPVLEDKVNDTEKKEQESGPCPIDFGFEIKIKGVKAFTQPIQIPAGQSKVIPLFSYEIQEIGKTLKIKGISSAEHHFTFPSDVKRTIYTATNDGKKYLVLSNLSNNSNTFKTIQPKSDTAYPQEQTIITTLGYYQASTVGRETQLTTKIPEFLSSDNYLYLGAR